MASTVPGTWLGWRLSGTSALWRLCLQERGGGEEERGGGEKEERGGGREGKGGEEERESFKKPVE